MHESSLFISKPKMKRVKTHVPSVPAIQRDKTHVQIARQFGLELRRQITPINKVPAPRDNTFIGIRILFLLSVSKNRMQINVLSGAGVRD